MFAHSFFPASYFAPVFYPPAENVTPPPDRVVAAGGSSGKRRKRPLYWWETEEEVPEIPEPSVDVGYVAPSAEPLDLVPRVRFQATPKLHFPDVKRRQLKHKQRIMAMIAVMLSEDE
jgi:hypothetical protein